MKYKKMNIYFRRGKYIWQKKKIFNIIRISFRWQKIIIQFLKKPNLISKFDNQNISSGSNPSARASRRAVQAAGSDGQRRRSIYYEGRKNSQGNIPTSAWPPFWSVRPWVMRWFSQPKAGDVGIFQNHQELPSEFAWKYTEKYTDLEKYPPRLRRSSRRNRPTLARLALSADRHSQSASQFRDAGASTQAQFLVYFDGSLRKKVRPLHKKNHLQQLNSLNYESFTIIKTGLAESHFSKKIVELNNFKKRTFGHNFLFRIQNILNSYTKCSQGPEYVIKYQLTKNIIYRALGPSPVITKFWNQDIFRLLEFASFRAKRFAPDGVQWTSSLWARGPSAWPQSWISPLSVSSDIPTRPLKPSGGLKATEQNQQLRLLRKAKLASPKSKVHSLSRWTLLTFPLEGHRTPSLGVLGGRQYRLQKSDQIYQNIWFQNFNKSNQNTYFLQRPISFPFQWIQKGDLLSDCSSSLKGELALGKNLLVAYMPWEGFNFEDAVLINDKVLSKYTSLHIEKYDLEIAESGLEKITYNIPGISPKNLQKLDKNGVVQIGSWVTEGDILVGRIIPMAPFTQNLLTHEKLLYDIVVFGQKDRQIQERCLRVPQGVSGRIIRISYTHQQKDPISHKKNFFETMLNFQSLFNFEKFNNELGVPIEGHQRQFKFAPLSTQKIYSKNGLNSFKKFMKERAERGPQAQCNELFEIYRQNLWGYSARKHTQNRSALRPSGPSAPLAPAGLASPKAKLKTSFRAVRSADGAEGLGSAACFAPLGRSQALDSELGLPLALEGHQREICRQDLSEVPTPSKKSFFSFFVQHLQYCYFIKKSFFYFCFCRLATDFEQNKRIKLLSVYFKYTDNGTGNKLKASLPSDKPSLHFAFSEAKRNADVSEESQTPSQILSNWVWPKRAKVTNDNKSFWVFRYSHASLFGKKPGRKAIELGQIASRCRLRRQRGARPAERRAEGVPIDQQELLFQKMKGEGSLTLAHDVHSDIIHKNYVTARQWWSTTGNFAQDRPRANLAAFGAGGRPLCPTGRALRRQPTTWGFWPPVSIVLRWFWLYESFLKTNRLAQAQLWAMTTPYLKKLEIFRIFSSKYTDKNICRSTDNEIYREKCRQFKNKIFCWYISWTGHPAFRASPKATSACEASRHTAGFMKNYRIFRQRGWLQKRLDHVIMAELTKKFWAIKFPEGQFVGLFQFFQDQNLYRKKLKNFINIGQRNFRTMGMEEAGSRHTPDKLAVGPGVTPLWRSQRGFAPLGRSQRGAFPFGESGQALHRHPFFFKQNQFRKQSQTKFLKIKENKPIPTGPEGQQEQSYVTSQRQDQAATPPRAWHLHLPKPAGLGHRWACPPSASRCQGPSARANKSIVFSSNNNYNFSQQNRLTAEATRLEGQSTLRHPPQPTPPPLFLNSLKKITIYIAEKREFQIGDKISGRHGNKGIISQIFSNSDMPYLSNGCTLDVLLNPLGVPSRMNVGQILECLLGFTGQIFHTKFRVLCFDEIYGYESSRSFIYSKLFELCKKTRQKLFLSKKTPGKFNLFDGRNGQLFYQSITVGSTYLMKLIHVVDEKIHARGTGPYSLITQQPLRGRAKHGGQRIGEMEVWALQGFGSAYTLQELLTVKSDDLHGRNQIMQTLLKNTPLRFGTPESLRVVLRELQCLCLDLQLSDTQ